MTTTLRPPRQEPVETPPVGQPTPPERHVSSAVEAAAEISLVLVTLAAVVSLGRLFADGSFLPRVLLAAVAAPVLAWGSRRLGLGRGAASLISVLGLLFVVAYVVEPQTLSGGLPLGKTWTAVHNDLQGALDAFSTVVPPAPATRGFVLACVITAWLCAFLADVAAF